MMEYAILISLLAIGLMAAVVIFRNSLSDLYEDSSTQVEEAVEEATAAPAD